MLFRSLEHTTDVNNALTANEQHPITYGSDCSGIDVGAYCLQRLGTSFTHEFISEIDPVARRVPSRISNPNAKLPT